MVQARRLWRTAAALAWVCLALGRPALADENLDALIEVGFIDLADRLGSAVPTGAGILVGQVEAATVAGGTGYLPNAGDSQLLADTIIDVTGLGGVSGHATNVGRHFYGSQSMAPGVNTVRVYSAGHWLSSGLLRAQTPFSPLVASERVINNSWKLDYDTNPANDAAEEAFAIDVLRRLDLVIDRDQVIVVAGVDNGASSDVPLGLANAYNVIAVGNSQIASSSVGGSTLDGVGRSKPDLVAPGKTVGSGSTVSRATARVSAGVSLLLEAAGSDPLASRPETIKAVLLAGATKTEFDLDQLTPTTNDDWSRTTTQPLDLRYGAGELNVNNSHLILTAGPFAPSSANLADSTGWNLSVGITSAQRYFFSVPHQATFDSLSIIATWNREVTLTPNGGNPAILTPSLANVDLRLYNAAFNPVSQQYEIVGSPIDQSLSTIDNVEHVFQRALSGGVYAIEVIPHSSADVAVAWQSQLTHGRELAIVSLDSTTIRTFDTAGVSNLFADSGDGLLSPISTVYDTAGNLYVSDVLKSQIVKFDPFGSSSVFAGLSSGLATPTGLAFDALGNLYVADYLTHRIGKFDPFGQATLFADASDGVSGPFDVAVDSLGNVYVASLDSRTILKFDSAGNGSLFADASDGLTSPIGLAIDEFDRVYVSDFLTSRIYRFATDGTGSIFADAGDGLATPTGLAFDSLGNLLVADYLTNRVGKIDPLGNAVLYAGAVDGLSGPFDIAVLPTGAPFIPLLSNDGGSLALAAADHPALGNEAFAPLPEPGAMALAISGCLVLLGAMKRWHCGPGATE